VDGRHRVAVIANKKIADGDEITFDYNWVADASTVQVECHCGSDRC